MEVQDNALARLVKSRLEDSGDSYSSIALRAGMPKSTVHKLATSPIGALPKRETLEKLAVGLDLPVETVIRAAQEAAGYHLYQEALPDSDTVILVNSIEKLTVAQRASVAALVNHLLRTSD